MFVNLRKEKVIFSVSVDFRQDNFLLECAKTENKRGQRINLI